METPKEAPESKESKDAFTSALEDAESKLPEKVKEEVKVEPEAKPEATLKPVLEEKMEVPEPPKEETPPDTKAQTVGEVLGKEKEVRTIPEAVLLEYKNQNKELKKDMEELKTLMKEGGSKQEVSESLREIAEEHNVDVGFLEKLTKAIKLEAQAEISAKMQPLEDRERIIKRDNILNDAIDKQLEAMPEYTDIAKKDIVRSLALLEENAAKTIPQILEETYGHLIQGRKTIDSGAAGRSTTDEITEIDFKRAESDGDYLKKILANPKLKKEYNDDMMKKQIF